MKSIGNLIQSELASYRPVILPGVGTLSVKRIGAEISGDKIQAPVNVVDFDPHEQQGEDIIAVLQTIGLSHDEARTSYDQWISQMRSGDTIIIESVGVLSSNGFRADPQMEELINPDVAVTSVGAKPAAEVKEAAPAAEKPNGGGKDGKKKGKGGVVLWFIFVIILLAILCFLLMRRCGSPEYAAQSEKAETERVERQDRQGHQQGSSAAQTPQDQENAASQPGDNAAQAAGSTNQGSGSDAQAGTGNGAAATQSGQSARAGGGNAAQAQSDAKDPARAQTANQGGQRPATTGTTTAAGTSKFPAYRQGVPMYYVIAGAFGQAANADKLVAKYRQGGIDAEIVPVKRGNLTMVALYASENLSEANRKRAEFQRTLDPGMNGSFWIYTRR